VERGREGKCVHGNDHPGGALRREAALPVPDSGYLKDDPQKGKIRNLSLGGYIEGEKRGPRLGALAERAARDGGKLGSDALLRQSENELRPGITLQKRRGGETTGPY